MLPDFSSLGFVSLVGAVMSAGYCTIAVGLSAATKRDPNISYEPLQGVSGAESVFTVFNALSTIMFAYGGESSSSSIYAIGISAGCHSAVWLCVSLEASSAAASTC